MQGTGLRFWKLSLITLLLIQSVGLRSMGQSLTGDARQIGMGGAGENENIGSQMITDQQQYRSIVIPLGVIQLIRDRHYFNPDDAAFNPVRALEDAGNPIHLTARGDVANERFVTDLVNATFSRNLNNYRGFIPAREITAQGLASPSFGHVFRFRRNTNGSFDGIYVGAGPYLYAKTVFSIDDQLRQLLSSSQDVLLQNATLRLMDQSAGEGAAAITLGYRRRMALPGGGRFNDRSGIYIAGNYHYLRGFRYDSADLQVRFDTDGAGLITISPTTVPISADHFYSNKGNGFALDLGVGVVVNRWQFGVGANGIANRIDWDNLRREQITLQNLFTGGNFVRQPQASNISTTRVELPVETNGNVGYNGDSWSAVVQAGRGFQGNTFHGGIEKRIGPIALRGGGRHSRELWHPAGGIGFNLTRGFGIDFAAFDTTANIEKERRVAFAMSLRFNRQAKDNN